MAPRIPFIGAFESTYLPGHDVDVAETSQHSNRWRADVDAVLRAGVTRFRYPLRWHRIESDPGRYDWSETDAALEYFQARGAEPIVDLVHHTSYPNWLTDGFRDARFAASFVRYAEAVAGRYPNLTAYTLFNEPFATLFLAGHQALWPPFDHGVEGLVRLALNVLPALSAASECWSQLLPEAEHIWVDTCEHHAGTPGGPADYAALANDRRHVMLDLALGQNLETSRPMLQAMLGAGGGRLLDLKPVRVDVLGLDYYCHSEWWYTERGGQSPSPHPLGLAAVASHYAARYQLPLLLAETNLRGLPSDRASWLRYTLEQYELALQQGLDLRGFCWFPSVDSCDWDSLLARPAGRVDPVGITSIGPDGERIRTRFTKIWEAAASGAAAADLPAYRFQPPSDGRLAGFIEQLGHWPWEDPPAKETPAAVTVPTEKRTEMNAPLLPQAPAGDLVVLSHLRWSWVWQRPQHLVSRFAAHRAVAGAQTWFVEEPVVGDVRSPQLLTELTDGVTRAWLVLPRDVKHSGHVGFDAPGSQCYGELLSDLLARHGVKEPEVLLYTPMALDIAEQLSPSRLFYDVMDDLASFLNAPTGLVLRHRRALSEADVVFTGGRSLHRSVSQLRSGPCHLFPSGVETAHYARSRRLRAHHDRKVAGYVGVLDERVDLELLAALAAQLPDWTIRMVGPVTKIEETSLPQAPNLEYPGMARYADLPAVMAGFDVALMPFALNEATRSISPTKTLEYLAAGLPVVSTRVADVVADYQGVVHFADDGAGFASACRQVVRQAGSDWDQRIYGITKRHEWDVIADRMGEIMASTTVADAVSEARA